MRLLATIILLGASFATCAAARKDACEPDLISEIPLHVAPNGKVFVPVRLGAHEVYFDLALATGLPFVGETAVSHLGLVPRGLSGTAEITSGGRRITQYVRLEEMSIGGYKLLPRAAPISPQPGLTSVPMVNGRPYVGRMGSTFLRRVDVELSLAEKKMRLFRPFECRSRSPVYWNAEAAALSTRYDDAGTLVFNLELNGKLVESSLLGSNIESTIDANVTRRYFGFDQDSPDATRANAADGSGTTLFHAMSLTGPGLSIADARIALQAGRTCKLIGSRAGYGGIGYDRCLNTVPFTLGTDLLKRMRIYLSSVRQQIFISVVPDGADQGGILITAPE